MTKKISIQPVPIIVVNRAKVDENESFDISGKQTLLEQFKKLILS